MRSDAGAEMMVVPPCASLSLGIDDPSDALVIGGLIVALVLAWALYVISHIRYQSKHAEAANAALLKEISERARMEESLSRSEARTRAILETSLDGVIAMDHRGAITEFNPAAEKIFGYSRDQAIGKPLSEVIVPPAFRERYREGLKSFLSSGQSALIGRRIEMTAMRADGTEFPVELTVTCSQGSPPPVFTGYIRDITEQKRNVDALRSNESRLRLLTERMPAIVGTTDENLRVTSVAGAGLRLLKLSPEQIVGRTLLEIVPQKDPPHPWITAHWRALKGESVTCEASFAGRLLETHVEPVHDRSGRITGVISVALDITEVKRAREERDRFFSLMPDLFCIVDPSGDFKLLNPSWETVLGIPIDRLQSRSFLDWVHPEDRPGVAKELDKLGGGAVMLEFESRLACPDGSNQWFSWCARAYLEQRIIYVLGRDITERKVAERRLKLQYTVARALAEFRSLQEAFPKIFQALCTELGFDVCEYWSPDASGYLQCQNSWHAPNADVESFLAAGRRARFEPGVGLPGAVWTRGESLWIPEVGQDPQFMRANEAALAGLHSAFAFPIRSGTETLGIIQLLSRAPRKPDRNLIELSEAVGRHIGQFIKRKSAEESLRELEERFRLLVDGVFEYSIIMLDPRGNVVSWNTGAERITGYRADEIIGRHFSLFYRKEDALQGKPERELEAAGAEGRCKDEGWRIRKDGTRFWASIAMTAMRDEGGTLRGYSKVMHDMTERKRAEREISESESRYRMLAENATDMIGSYTAEGTVRYVSPASRVLLGFEPEEIVGRSAFDLIPEEDGEKIREIHRKILASAEPCTFTIRHRRKDGTCVWLETTARAVHEPGGGDVQEIIAVSRDITQRMEIEEMRSEIISIVSHELRTPLASIRGSLGLLAGGVAGPLAAEAQHLVDIASKNSERLSRLINDYLDLKSIESGKIRFDVKPVAIGPLLEQALESNRVFGVEHGVRFALNQPFPDARVLVDPDRLTQVLTNLLSNAAKFSPPGETVMISVDRGSQGIRVSVIDRGPGIPEEFRPRIFQKFAQADQTRKGSGLGLSISKAIVEKMGGHIGFETRPDSGTTFFLELPESKSPAGRRTSPTERVGTL